VTTEVAARRPPWPAKTVALTALVLVLLAATVYIGTMTSPAGSVSVIGPAALMLMFLTMAAVGQVVARYQPRNPIGFLLLSADACFLLGLVSGGYAMLVYPLHHHGLPLGTVALMLNPVGSAAIVMLPIIVLLFPDGHLPSRRWKQFLGAAVAIAAYNVAVSEIAIVSAILGHHLRVSADGTPAITGPFVTTADLAGILIVCAVCVASVVRQVLAWRHASGERRQQIKWLISGVCVFALFALPSLGVSSQIWEVGIAVGFSALPVAIGIGILKYRLYDIDRIISRTLAYAVVTGLLLGVYAGLVLLATRVLAFHTPVAVAASTLAAAALFNPVRRRVQRAADRRFNRARYDADRTVAAFAARLKDAVDLASVRDDLTGVVQETLEPVHVSVWTSERR
jgi:hypothetical protein